jgi:hypothetical protein
VTEAVIVPGWRLRNRRVGHTLALAVRQALAAWPLMRSTRNLLAR